MRLFVWSSRALQLCHSVTFFSLSEDFVSVNYVCIFIASTLKFALTDKCLFLFQLCSPCECVCVCLCALSHWGIRTFCLLPSISFKASTRIFPSLSIDYTLEMCILCDFCFSCSILFSRAAIYSSTFPFNIIGLCQCLCVWVCVRACAGTHKFHPSPIASYPYYSYDISFGYFSCILLININVAF